MATGFTQRWKGKVAAEVLFMKGWGFSEVSTATPASGSTLNQQWANYVLTSGSAASVFTLAPVEEGAMVKLLPTSVSSGIFVKASTTAPAGANNFGVIGSTILVLKSTSQMAISLIGVSSLAWQIDSVWSTSTTAIAMPTFSTTT